METNGQTKLCVWNADRFPHDDWGVENMNRAITFQDVFECLQVGGNIYALLGADDSVVRERVFDELAALMGCSYDHVYYQWLNGTKKPLGNKIVIDMNGLRFKKDESI